MKTYSKQPIPEAYKKWFDENKERLLAKPIDETQLFEAITPKLKRALNNPHRFPNLLKCIFSIQPSMIVSIILNMNKMVPSNRI
jgi:hypothetical protein